MNKKRNLLLVSGSLVLCLFILAGCTKADLTGLSGTNQNSSLGTEDPNGTPPEGMTPPADGGTPPEGMTPPGNGGAAPSGGAPSN